MAKIALFVDVQNIYYTTRDAYQRPLNYRALWQEIATEGNITVANAYAIASQQDGQIKFQDALKHIGFNVKLKPFIQRSDGSAKGDWDVGITIDVMSFASDVDRIILLSGDGDFDLLAQAVKERYNIPFDVYGVPSLTADSLIKSASTFIPITPAYLK